MKRGGPKKGVKKKEKPTNTRGLECMDESVAGVCVSLSMSSNYLGASCAVAGGLGRGGGSEGRRGPRGGCQLIGV